MPGPGEYRPDPTVGSAAPRICPRPRSASRAGTTGGVVPVLWTRRLSRQDRSPHPPRPGQPLHRAAARHRRALLTALLLACRKYFNADMADLADPGSHYTRRVIDIAVRLVVEDGLPYRTAGWTLWRDHRVFVPYATIQNWVEAGGKKGARRIDTEHLDWALSDFSGYIAADGCMTGRSVSCRSSTTAPSNGSPTGSWTTTRPTPTSRRSSATSTRLSRRGG